MVRRCSIQRMIFVGLATLAAAVGLFSMPAGAAPPLQEPYPPPCPCTLVLQTTKAVTTPGECIPVTCRVTDGTGSPAVDLVCDLSIVSQPGTDAALTPPSAMTDQNGETETELCVGSAPGSIEVKGESECCEGQLKVTVQMPPLAEELIPSAPPATGSGTSGGSSWPVPLMAICSAMLLAAGAALVWRAHAGQSQSS
jgi:hypothetical protein